MLLQKSWKRKPQSCSHHYIYQMAGGQAAVVLFRQQLTTMNTKQKNEFSKTKALEADQQMKALTAMAKEDWKVYTCWQNMLLHYLAGCLGKRPLFQSLFVLLLAPCKSHLSMPQLPKRHPKPSVRAGRIERKCFHFLCFLDCCCFRYHLLYSSLLAKRMPGKYGDQQTLHPLVLPRHLLHP